METLNISDLKNKTKVMPHMLPGVIFVIDLIEFLQETKNFNVIRDKFAFYNEMAFSENN